jgi:positive regulator of sigma E activity
MIIPEATLVLAGIVAKGLGAIAIIFALGLIVGVILTLSVSRRFRR